MQSTYSCLELDSSPVYNRRVLTQPSMGFNICTEIASGGSRPPLSDKWAIHPTWKHDSAHLMCTTYMPTLLGLFAFCLFRQGQTTNKGQPDYITTKLKGFSLLTQLEHGLLLQPNMALVHLVSQRQTPVYWRKVMAETGRLVGKMCAP